MQQHASSSMVQPIDNALEQQEKTVSLADIAARHDVRSFSTRISSTGVNL